MSAAIPAAAVATVLDRAAPKTVDALRAAHVDDYGDCSIVSRSISARPRARRWPSTTCRRVRDGRRRGAGGALLSIRRYLLISSSRPGSQPANLQGIWNDNLTPSWGSKFTININTEMNYWPAEVCNLSETHQPLFDLVDAARGPGRQVAQAYYGARGFVIHHNTDLWGDAVPIDGVGSGIWPMGGAWLALHFWEHYDFTRDRKFLAERAYPAMKEAAEFLLDYLVDDGHGHLVTGPSLSPENRFSWPMASRTRWPWGRSWTSRSRTRSSAA